jgi:hypothetical protein
MGGIRPSFAGRGRWGIRGGRLNRWLNGSSAINLHCAGGVRPSFAGRGRWGMRGGRFNRWPNGSTAINMLGVGPDDSSLAARVFLGMGRFIPFPRFFRPGGNHWQRNFAAIISQCLRRRCVPRWRRIGYEVHRQLHRTRRLGHGGSKICYALALGS